MNAIMKTLNGKKEPKQITKKNRRKVFHREPNSEREVPVDSKQSLLRHHKRRKRYPSAHVRRKISQQQLP